MCSTVGEHSAPSCILCFSGCADTTEHLTKIGHKKFSWLLIHRLPGTYNETQTFSSAWKSSLVKTKNHSFHLGHPTEGKNGDDNRKINKLLKLLNSMLHTDWEASQLVPEEHFLAEKHHQTVPPTPHCNSDSCLPPWPGEDWTEAQRAPPAHNPPAGVGKEQQAQWGQRNGTGQRFSPTNWTYSCSALSHQKLQACGNWYF